MIPISAGIDNLFNDLLESKQVSNTVKELVKRAIEFQKKSPEKMNEYCGVRNFTVSHNDEYGNHPPSAIHYRIIYGPEKKAMVNGAWETTRDKITIKCYLLKSIIGGHWFSVPAEKTVFTLWPCGPVYDVVDFKGYKYAVKRKEVSNGTA